LGVSALASLALTGTAVPTSVAAGGGSTDWPMFGQNLNNTANSDSKIATNNVSTLKPKWVFTTGGDVSARAAVIRSAVATNTSSPRFSSASVLISIAASG